ncbi:Arrestin domain-containing protein A [Phytophthora cinnamomi]|uniref:Arrestin domain-containing protein A n=1 Tax=Phytophthora cinnamomi TaxID=4785 RepID=UPI00355A4E03|nr:Arrestin domain-containing protein A [Phytophthora cinnamomi]
MAELNYALMRQAVQVEEAKRARQREHVKNNYHRKQSVIKALRQEMQGLEHEYSRTLQRKQQQLQWREVAEALGCDESRKHSDDLVEQYMQLSIKKERLRQENQELALMTAKHAKLHLRAENLLASNDLPLLKPPTTTLNSMTFEPMTISECHQVAIEAYQEIRAFLESNNYLTTGHELFGWTEQRREATDHVKFTLKKNFMGSTPAEMSARAWRVVSSPQGLAGLYSSTMRVSLKVLQVVDNHNVIMHRVLQPARTKKMVRSLFLVSRFHVESGGYMVLFRSVNRNRLQNRCHGDIFESVWDEGVDDEWLDLFAWTLFEDVPENNKALTFSYGGIVYSTEAVGTHVWMLEILMLAIQWETKVVGPTFKLCA